MIEPLPDNLFTGYQRDNANEAVVKRINALIEAVNKLLVVHPNLEAKYQRIKAEQRYQQPAIAEWENFKNVP